jgi:hypothetical protein
MTSAPTATRTRDLPLRRRSLYPLSYRGYSSPSLPGIADARRQSAAGAGFADRRWNGRVSARPSRARQIAVHPG